MTTTRERRRVTPATPGSAVRVNVFTQVGGFCVAVDDGEKLFRLLHRALQAGKRVEVSFEGVESLSSSFLNAAIGQLIGAFDAAVLRDRLHIVDLNDDDRVLLKRVIANARRYFADPARYKAALKEARSRV